MTHFTDTISERAISQYQDSILFSEFLKALTTEADELFLAIQDVINKRFLFNATGKQLDIIGQIVGISRVVVDFQVGVFFGFDPEPTSLGFDDLFNDVQAGRYRSADELTGTARLLGDTEYRVLIVAKILANTSDITPNAVLLITDQIMKAMFGQNSNINVNILEKTNAEFDIIIMKQLTAAEQAYVSFLDLIPRPAGVKINYVYITPPNNLLTESGLSLFYQDGTDIEIQF